MTHLFFHFAHAAFSLSFTLCTLKFIHQSIQLRTPFIAFTFALGATFQALGWAAKCYQTFWDRTESHGAFASMWSAFAHILFTTNSTWLILGGVLFVWNNSSSYPSIPYRNHRNLFLTVTSTIWVLYLLILAPVISSYDTHIIWNFLYLNSNFSTAIQSVVALGFGSTAYLMRVLAREEGHGLLVQDDRATEEAVDGGEEETTPLLGTQTPRGSSRTATWFANLGIRRLWVITTISAVLMVIKMIYRIVDWMLMWMGDPVPEWWVTMVLEGVPMLALCVIWIHVLPHLIAA